MTEKFLHYIWRMKLFDAHKLQTTDWQKITVINTGTYNTDAGPDFLNAKIKIDVTTWVGHVELHMKSSDWKKHAHQNDAAYNNVILHIVYDADDLCYDSKGNELACLELKGKFDEGSFKKYTSLLSAQSWVACDGQLHLVDDFTKTQWLQRLMIERMEEKIQPIENLLAEIGNNWEEVFYRMLAHALGSRVNADVFEKLAKLVPLKILAKHKSSLFQLEALLFGAAGFLEDKFADDYPKQLQKEFSFYRKKYRITPLKKHYWKFLRLRPANFPTIRLAQLAQLVFQSSHLFSKLLSEKKVMRAFDFFKADVSEYWLTHYRFDKISPSKRKPLGSDAIELLFINTMIPILFVHARNHDDEQLGNRALNWLEQLPSEKNTIIEKWKASGIASPNALQSQALLQLKNNYCKNFRCLDCAIGHRLLSKV